MFQKLKNADISAGRAFKFFEIRPSLAAFEDVAIGPPSNGAEALSSHPIVTLEITQDFHQ